MDWAGQSTLVSCLDQEAPLGRPVGSTASVEWACPSTIIHCLPPDRRADLAQSCSAIVVDSPAIITRLSLIHFVSLISCMWASRSQPNREEVAWRLHSFHQLLLFVSPRVAVHLSNSPAPMRGLSCCESGRCSDLHFSPQPFPYLLDAKTSH